MPTASSDWKLLAACGAAIVGGVALICVGLLLEPPRRLLKALG